MKTVLCRARSVFLSGALVLVSFAPLGRAQNFSGPSLLAPTNGASFFTGVDIKMTAHAVVAVQAPHVEFFANAQLLGVVSNGVSLLGGGEDFTFDWTNAAAGVYGVNARLIRSGGASTSTATNSISVLTAKKIRIALFQPTNGTTFSGPGNSQLFAGAGESNGAIALVEFFDGGRSLGIETNGPVLDPPFPSGWVVGDRAYLCSWTNQSIGTHILTVGALDTNGQAAYSEPVTVIIGSNLPPTVLMTSPPNNAFFRAPVDISLGAYARDPDGVVASVQFFAGTTNLGFGQGLPPLKATPLIAGIPPPVFPAPTNSFVLTWNNAPVGSFSVTAVATDGLGASTTSAPVNLTVLPSTSPPPTNLPDIVGVIATDPIAIASTDCWTWRGLTNGLGNWTQWVSPVSIWRSFTNCGPKDATFTVHRVGAIDADLVVNYNIAGSATNGVDYVALPGSVTIPAGQMTAAITIVPIENGSNYVRSVILTIDSSTNAPSAYLAGIEARAEVLIADGLWARFPAAALLGDGSFHLNLPGPDGAWFHVDYSTNLVNWIALCTNQVIDGSVDFVDPNAAGSPHRIYRTVPMANAPSQ